MSEQVNKDENKSNESNQVKSGSLDNENKHDQSKSNQDKVSSSKNVVEQEKFSESKKEDRVIDSSNVKNSSQTNPKIESNDNKDTNIDDKEKEKEIEIKRDYVHYVDIEKEKYDLKDNKGKTNEVKQDTKQPENKEKIKDEKNIQSIKDDKEKKEEIKQQENIDKKENIPSDKKQLDNKDLKEDKNKDSSKENKQVKEETLEKKPLEKIDDKKEINTNDKDKKNEIIEKKAEEKKDDKKEEKKEDKKISTNDINKSNKEEIYNQSNKEVNKGNSTKDRESNKNINTNNHNTDKKEIENKNISNYKIEDIESKDSNKQLNETNVQKNNDIKNLQENSKQQIEDEDSEIIYPSNEFIKLKHDKEPSMKIDNSETENYDYSDLNKDTSEYKWNHVLPKEKDRVKQNSKMQEILNTFPDKREKNANREYKNLNDYKKSQVQEETIIFPSNKNKNRDIIKEKALNIENELNERINDDRKRNMFGSPSSNRRDEIEDRLQTNNYLEEDNRVSSSLLTSIRLTQNMIESFSNQGRGIVEKQNQYNPIDRTSQPKVYGGIYSSNIINSAKVKNISNNMNSPKETKNEVERGAFHSKKKSENQNTYKSNEEFSPSQQKLEETKEYIYKGISKPNSIENNKEYFSDLYSNLKSKNKNLQILDEKISRVSSKPFDRDENPESILKNNSNIYNPNQHNQETSSRYLNISENDHNNNYQEDKIANKINSLKEALNKREEGNNKHHEILAKLKDIPKVDLSNKESKKNYASVIKENLDEYAEKKKSLDQKRDDYFASIKLDKLVKKDNEEINNEQKTNDSKTTGGIKKEEKIESDSKAKASKNDEIKGEMIEQNQEEVNNN